LFIDFAFAIVVALVLSLLLVPWMSGRRMHARGSLVAAFLFFFFVLLLTTWAGGLWLSPIGPPLWGVYWLPFVIVGLLVALIMAAAADVGGRRYGHAGSEATETEVAAVTAFGLLFWVLMLTLLAAIVFGYLIE